MEGYWLTFFMLVAIFIATVLLAVVCLDCRIKGPQASISQTIPSEEHTAQTRFMVIHPSLPHSDQNSFRSPSNLLSPQPNSLNSEAERRLRPYTPTETESNPSYENPVPGTDFLDSDAEDNGYIKVLPETDPAPANPSRASTPSSDIPHYVNVEEAKIKPGPEHDTDSESESNYQNVEEVHLPRSTPDLSSRSEDDDDDDDEGNYVNQPPMIH